MTELAIHQQPVAAVETIPAGAMRLVEWAREAEAAHQLATALCETPFAGQFYKNPGAATAAILKGAEVGLTPVTSLGAFDLIQGTPAPKAITLRALVQSQGHAVWIDKSTDTECIAKARRAGQPEIHTSRWTIQRAQRLNLTGKDNWKKQPDAMLVARATSEVCRLVAADVILGIGYSSEELLDDATPVPVRTMQRALTPAPEADPVVHGDEQPGPPPTDEPDGITSAQLKKMGAGMREAGITERAAALAFVAATIGREVSSRNELNRAEASQVIDALERSTQFNTSEPEPDLEDGAP